MERVGSDASSNIRGWGARLAESGWWHSFELPDGRTIQGANTLESLKNRLALFPIPQDLTGKRVLDIGAWDGWFSFEMERRGAEVVSVDQVEIQHFRYLHRELRSKIDYRILDVYELSPSKLGTFDIVLFLGVLYHLKHPLLALEKVCALTKDLAVVETFVSPDTGSPAMEFFETDELGGQFDNWVAPNLACVTAMCRTAGFARAETIGVSKVGSASVACFRRFADVEGANLAPPRLAACVHVTNLGVNFCSAQDEYASAWFSCDAANLSRGDVQVSAGPFHSAPVSLTRLEGSWHVNFKIPLGLEPGWREVRIRTNQSQWSNPCRIAIDLPLTVESLVITGAADAKTWVPFEIQTGGEAVLSVWVEGLPENRDYRNVHVRLGEQELRVDFLSPWEPDKPTQINVRIPPEELAAGTYLLTVQAGGALSAPVAIACK